MSGRSESPDSGPHGAWPPDGPLAVLPARHPRQVTNLDFSRDGRLLVSTSVDGTLMVWDMATRTLVGAPVEIPTR